MNFNRTDSCMVTISHIFCIPSVICITYCPMNHISGNTQVAQTVLQQQFFIASNLLHNSVNIHVGTAVAQWLRCCATNRKVAVLYPGRKCIMDVAVWRDEARTSVRAWR